MSDFQARLLAAIRRVMHVVDSHSKRVERQVGLTLPQLVVLSAIRALGEVTTGRLSKAVSLSQATVTTVLDKLEAKGLVERYRNPVDRRIVHTRLSAHGHVVLDAAPPLLAEPFVARFTRLAEARRLELVRALEEVAEMMDAPVEPPAGAGEDPIAPTEGAPADAMIELPRA